MTDSAEIIKTALESKTVEKLYEDAISPSAEQIGKLSKDTIKTIRLLFAPIQVLSALQDRLEIWIDRIRNKVPIERQTEAPPQIVGPIIEILRYMPDDDILTECFLNLIAKSIDKNHKNEAHPAFIRIIEQLSPDEALFLYELHKKELYMVDTMDYDQSRNLFENRKIEKSEVPTDKFAYPEYIDVYYNHLESLGLIIWPVYKQEPIHSNGVQTGIRRYSKLRLTEFGNLFVSACIPDKEYIDSFVQSHK